MRDVKRAASGHGGENRLLQLLRPSFGLLVVVLIIAGTAFVAVAYTQRDVKARPVQNEDHWHSPYGVWDCAAGDAGDFMPPFQSDDDPLGIHSHGDGIIHVHPFFERSSGRGAVLGHFLDSMNVSVSVGSIVLDDGTPLVSGVTCDPPGGLPEKCETMSEEERGADRDCDNVAIIQVRRWEFATSSDEAPEVFTEGFDQLRFLNNGEAWVIARAPRYADVPPPPSIPYLEYVDPNAFSRVDEQEEGDEE